MTQRDKCPPPAVEAIRAFPLPPTAITLTAWANWGLQLPSGPGKDRGPQGRNGKGDAECSRTVSSSPREASCSLAKRRPFPSAPPSPGELSGHDPAWQALCEMSRCGSKGDSLSTQEGVPVRSGKLGGWCSANRPSPATSQVTKSGPGPGLNQHEKKECPFITHT